MTRYDVKLEDVRRNYDRVAGSYDFWTDAILGRVLGLDRVREHALDQLGDLRKKTVLDIGCGTGRNLPGLESRVGPSGHVIGIDYSAGMLEEARSLVAERGWRNVTLLHDDATQLRHVVAPVDAVVSVWCMGIVYDLEAALDRAVDLLRPGGRMVIMDFARARPDHGPLHYLYPAYSRVLRWAGIDSEEDLDDARLRAKWARGQALLHERLENVEEERYLSGGGLIITGTAPARIPAAA